MSNDWPLLDIAQALNDADQALSDIVYYVHMLQADTEGHYPPDAEQLLANVAAIRVSFFLFNATGALKMRLDTSLI